MFLAKLWSMYEEGNRDRLRESVVNTEEYFNMREKRGRWRMSSDFLKPTLLRRCWRRRRHFPSWPVQNRFLFNWKQRWIRRAWMISISMLYCVELAICYTVLFSGSYHTVMLKYIYVPDMKLANSYSIWNVNLCNTRIINCKLINLLNVSWNFANGSSSKSACDG